MRKVLNWIGGSFFRTLGRYLFYIFIGSLFYLLISKLNLFNYVVKADEVSFYPQFAGVTLYYSDYNYKAGTTLYYGGQPDSGGSYSLSDYYSVNTFRVYFNLSNNILWPDLDKKYYFESGKLYTLTFKFLPSKTSSEITFPYLYNLIKPDSPYNMLDYIKLNEVGYYDLSGELHNDINIFSYTNFSINSFHLNSQLNNDMSPTPLSYNEYIIVIRFILKEDVQALYFDFDPNNDLIDEEGNKYFDTNFIRLVPVSFTVNSDTSSLPDTPGPVEPTPGGQDTTNKEILDNLTDDSPPDVNGLGDVAGYLPPGPLDSLLNLPLTFLTNINNALSGSCKPLELPLPFVNKKLILPCVNTLYDQINGLTIAITSWSIIASAFMLYSYFIYLYNWVDKLLSMDDFHLKAWGII